MSKRAWIYIWSVFAASAVLCVGMLRDVALPSAQWLPCLVLTVLATLAQLHEATTERATLHPHALFFFAGVLLLDPLLFLVLITVPHVVEWAVLHRKRGEQRRNWYVQPLNIAMYSIVGALTRSVYTWMLPGAAPTEGPLPVVAGAVAALTYVITNRLIAGQVLVLVHGMSWRAAGVWDPAHVWQECIAVYLGYSMAVLWNLNPWYSMPAIAPLLLVHQALRVPHLTREAHTDSKTGLLNASYFDRVFAEELERARHFKHPLAVIMADLDDPRGTTATYDLVAGDVILAGVAQVLRSTVRELDLVGHFGGAAFVLVLPETQLNEAQVIAERIRATVAITPFESLSGATSQHATVSIGVACFPQDATTQTELIHRADVALYRAKAQGRNCIVCAADVAQDATHTSGEAAHSSLAPALRAAQAELADTRKQAALAAQDQRARACSRDPASAPRKAS